MKLPICCSVRQGQIPFWNENLVILLGGYCESLPGAECERLLVLFLAEQASFGSLNNIRWKICKQLL